MADRSQLKSSADPTLIQTILRAFNKTSGFEPFQDMVGVGKHLVTAGIPDSVEMTPQGRFVLRDKDVTNPETVGNVISLPADATPLEEGHEYGDLGAHTSQHDVLGPAMLLVKSLEGLYPYGQGPLESNVYTEQEPDNPIGKQKSPDFYQNMMRAYLNATTGTGRK